jgi:hypothetical protein
MDKKYYQYSGIIHVHSTYSDGALAIPRIAEIANELDFNFLLFSDHNTLQPKREGLEGWYDKVLVGIGCEINDVSDQNHYLAFNIDEEISIELAPKDYVRKVHEAGGFGIIAHPDEKRTSMAEYPPYPWTVWDSEYYDGIEVWNQMSEWMEGLTHQNKYWRVLHPRRSIIAPKKETLAKWDEVNQKRKVVGIGGVDAHGHVYRFWGLFRITIFRYKVLFKTIRTHVLTSEPLSQGTDYKGDLQKIYKAIQNANCYISNHYLGDAADFRFWAENKQKQVIVGENITLDGQTKLYIKNPQEAETLLIHNGKIIESKKGRAVNFVVREKGVYRVEIHINQQLWIISNHISVV